MNEMSDMLDVITGLLINPKITDWEVNMRCKQVPELDKTHIMQTRLRHKVEHLLRKNNVFENSISKISKILSGE